MIRRPIFLTTAAILVALVSIPSRALQLMAAETAANIAVPPAPVQPFLALRFSGELVGHADGRGDLIVTWEDAGGIEPTPFRILIPAGCFQPGEGSLMVPAFRTCGVSAVYRSLQGTEEQLRLRAFNASIVRRRGYARLEISAAIVSRGIGTDILGALGGAAMQVAVDGQQSNVVLPTGIEVVGFNPQPEPPPASALPR